MILCKCTMILANSAPRILQICSAKQIVKRACEVFMFVVIPVITASCKAKEEQGSERSLVLLYFIAILGTTSKVSKGKIRKIQQKL